MVYALIVYVPKKADGPDAESGAIGLCLNRLDPATNRECD
jgi:hypothetical protein